MLPVPSDPAPLLLAVAAGPRAYRGYLLESVSRGFRVHLFCTAEPTWERPFLDGWTVVKSTVDGPALVEAALALAESREISGVVCWVDDRTVAAAEVAEALGLPGGNPTAAPAAT